MKAVESKQLQYNTSALMLEKLDAWFIKHGRAKVNAMRFDIPNNLNIGKLRTMLAIKRILKTNLECDYKISEEMLEKIKKCIQNGM